MYSKIYRLLSHITTGRTSQYFRARYKAQKVKSQQIDDTRILQDMTNSALGRRIIFVHSVNHNNTGDVNCAPYKYFQDYWRTRNISIYDICSPLLDDIKKDDVVIVGGGGLMNFSDSWNRQINKILDKSDNVICWALGFNSHYDAPPITENIHFDKFKLIGNRDWKNEYGLPYLLCVSCMIDALASRYQIKREIGIVEHQDFPIPFDYERVNNKMPLETMLDFIGSSNIIITNGYHAMYWATMMGKKVILYKPFSSRYDHFKFKPVIYSGNLDNDIKKAKVYDNALTECRRLNMNFFERVRNIIESDE